MKNYNAFLVLLFIVMISCASNKSLSSATQDGLSIKNAVVVKNIPEEYQWVRAHYPGSSVGMQSLLEEKGKYYDMLTLKLENGEGLNVYFDINSFFGKGF